MTIHLHPTKWHEQAEQMHRDGWRIYCRLINGQTVIEARHD